jgi:membrane protease subunit HflC
MNFKATLLLLVLGLSLVFVGNGLYIVKEYEKALKLEFGRVEEDNIQPGLHWRWPFVNQIRVFDGRILTNDTEAQRFLTVEKKGMIVDYFAKWRISDPGKFYTANDGEERNADGRIAQIVNESLRNEFAERTLQEVVSGERDELMAAMINEIAAYSREELGVEIIDVRVKRIDLPEEVSESVFNRMKAEREREAREHRAIGREQAEITRAAADRQQTVIEAEAYRESEQIRGEGDAQAAAIYAEAYTKDPEFYSFFRSLTAYKETFKTRSDVLLVDPKSDFFRYLNNVDPQVN